MIHPMEKKATAACGGGEDFFIQILVRLPEDFFIQILVRLPVTSLLRFKSVCKSWRALIQTSYFINLHTTTTSNSSKFGTLILQALEYQHEHYSMKNAILMLSSGSESGSGSGSEYHDDQEVFKVNDDVQLVLKLQNFGLPSLCNSGEVIAGSCNGLICLHDSYNRTVSLWNPATRQIRRLPKAITIEKKFGDFDFVGFGFDVKTKDYKVVQISCVIGTTDIAQQWQPGIRGVHVYSLSTDSWRLLEGINLLPGLPMFGHHGLYLNGSYYFMGTKIAFGHNRFFMFSFDFTLEILTTVKFPDHDNRQNKVLDLSCLGEKLALFTKTTTNSSLGLVGPGPGGDQSHSSSCYEDYDIWVWNEHGACSSVNKEFWTKLHSFRIKNNWGGGAFEWTIPRGILNNGEFALIETGWRNSKLKKKKMQLFNLVTKEAKKDFLICKSVCRTHVYQQSLVSIIGGNDASTSSRSR